MKPLKALINKDVIKRIKHNSSFHLRKVDNPSKSDLQIGDFVITVEKENNMYIIVDGKAITWMGVPEEWIIIQADGYRPNGYLPLGDFSKDLKWDRLGSKRDYTIVHVFHTGLTMEDLMTKEHLIVALHKCANEVKRIYPEIEKELKN